MSAATSRLERPTREPLTVSAAKRARRTPSESREKAGTTAVGCEDYANAVIAAEAYVSGYLNRFRARPEDGLRSERGGGTQKRTDAELMRMLRTLSEMRGRAACACLREFLVAYGVSRTFAGLSEEKVERLAPVATHLRAHASALRAMQDECEIISAVDALVESCRDAGFSNNISFASKALNMLGIPVPIYSTEAHAYLALKRNPPYAVFYKAWMEAYVREGSAFEAAAERLLNHRCPLEMGLQCKWFAMRGLDVKMMDIGGPLR